ncbi:MAG: hypothetical protein HUJ27_06895 [Rhodobacteraceae bacterium]|nr:hypothetical protein [Paracoccaceae bacterium]
MGSITISIWTLLIGAVAGLFAVLGARGRNRLMQGAAIGAIVALVMSILRGFI